MPTEDHLDETFDLDSCQAGGAELDVLRIDPPLSASVPQSVGRSVHETINDAREPTGKFAAVCRDRTKSNNLPALG